MNKLSALWGVFRKGDAVSNPAAWKAGQITATMLGALVLALVNLGKAFGYELPIDADGANAIGGGVLVIVNCVLTITTSKTVGLPAKPAFDAPDKPLFPSSNG